MKKKEDEARRQVVENARALVRAADPVALLMATDACDGHTIFDPGAFAKETGLHVCILDPGLYGSGAEAAREGMRGVRRPGKKAAIAMDKILNARERKQKA